MISPNDLPNTETGADTIDKKPRKKSFKAAKEKYVQRHNTSKNTLNYILPITILLHKILNAQPLSQPLLLPPFIS